MIEKKNPKMDMERKRFHIFSLGLLVTGSFTLAAFTYSSPEGARVKTSTIIVPENYSIEVNEKEIVKPPIPKPEDVRPPQPPQLPQPLGNPTGLAQTISSVVSGTVGPAISDGTGAFGSGFPIVGKQKIDPDDKIVIPEIDAKYMGGHNAMVEKILTVQEYPDIDRELGIQGTVYVSFVVEKDGSVTNIETVKSISKTLDREAERIVRSFPKWIPGEDKYGVVRTRVNLPIKFVLVD